MDLTDMIYQTSAIVTEIKKCQSLFHYCNDKHVIYRYIIKEISRMNKVDILLEFLADDLRENCSLDELKKELLKLYHYQSQEFFYNMKGYMYAKEVVWA